LLAVVERRGRHCSSNKLLGTQLLAQKLHQSQKVVGIRGVPMVTTMAWLAWYEFGCEMAVDHWLLGLL
jgi:hypothetical protein